MGVLFLMNIFRLISGLKLSFEHNSVSKNLFLSACFCWYTYFSLGDVDEKVKFGGTIGYGDSYFEFLFRLFKVFRLHAILHDAAGAVRAHSSKSPGYCLMIGRGTNSSFLEHLTGLLFCLYVKLFLPSIFKFVDFWNIKSCIVKYIGPPDKNVFKEMGVFIWGKVQTYSIWPPKTYKPTKQGFWCTWTMAVPKLKISMMKKCGLARVVLSDKRPHFTMQSARQKCLVTGKCAI